MRKRRRVRRVATEKLVIVSCRTSRRVQRQLDNLARQAGVTPSSYLRGLLEQVLKQRESETPAA